MKITFIVFYCILIVVTAVPAYELGSALSNTTSSTVSGETISCVSNNALSSGMNSYIRIALWITLVNLLINIFISFRPYYGTWAARIFLFFDMIMTFFLVLLITNLHSQVAICVDNASSTLSMLQSGAYYWLGYVVLINLTRLGYLGFLKTQESAYGMNKTSNYL